MHSLACSLSAVSLKKGELASRLNESPADSRFFASGESGGEVFERRIARSFSDLVSSIKQTHV